MTGLLSRMDPHRRAATRLLLVEQAAPAAVAPRRRRMALAAALASVVAVIGVGVLAAYPDPPPPDYGTWTAVPQAAPPLTARHEDIEQWASKCNDLGVGGVGIEGVPARPEAAARRDVLVDRRGGFTYCVDVSVGSGTPADPLIALSGLKAGGRDGLNSMEATVFDKPFDVPRGGAVLVLGGTVETPPPGATGGLEAFQMYGLSGPDVTGVELVLRNGLRVTATLRHGVWGMWWPSDRGDPTGCELEVRTARGVRSVAAAAVRLHIG
ncbi:hypothetical protein COUCH_28470 [Couchioplanes caeruleus]|uniref:hypothetical protein n=1 Tax=Couchioplanes caeruleus TaxID=56438 RepID=UPI0020C02E6C|nr:hypothetical protein [Couchioplanes caeruleus]UQU62943.1 hypothetical protein COUCH_28470 [Couchioplanes caeruleus]